MALQTLLVRYTGQVQGVGFRATVRGLALNFTLRGWVKNELDGSVSMIASGDSGDLQRLLRAVRESRVGPMIDREEVEPQAAAVEVPGFEIKK